MPEYLYLRPGSCILYKSSHKSPPKVTGNGNVSLNEFLCPMSLLFFKKKNQEWYYFFWFQTLDAVFIFFGGIYSHSESGTV